MSSVGYQSTTCTISLLTFPAGTFPGQRMMQGVRFDPSRDVNRPPRHGPEDPFHVPPTGSGSIVWVWYSGSGPLSDAQTTIVSSASPSSSSLSSTTPVKSSISVRMSAKFPRFVLPAYSGSGIDGLCTCA